MPKFLSDLSHEQIDLQIYVPHSLFLSKKGKNVVKNGKRYLYGWSDWADEDRTSSILVIAGTMTEREAIDSKLGFPSKVNESVELCILGEAVYWSKSLRYDEKEVEDVGSHEQKMRRDSTRIWLVMEECDSSTASPRLCTVQIFTNGVCSSCAITTISYKIPRPDKMQYTSLEPMILPSSSVDGLSDSDEGPSGHSIRESAQSFRLEQLVELDPLRFMDLNRKYEAGKAPGQTFRHCIDLINQVAYVRDSIISSHRNGQTGNVQKRSKFAESWRIASQGIQLVRKLLTSSIHPRIPTLISFSSSARQLNLRLGQISVWPSLARKLRLARVREHQPVSILGPQYTALYNGVWLVANDLIVGQAIGLILCDKSEQIAKLLKINLGPVLTVSIIGTLRWLDSWPLGIKLNTPLSRFFCDWYTGMTEIWSEQVLSAFVSEESQALCRLIFVIGMATRFFGVSMMLCILVDLLNVIMFYLNMFYLLQWHMYAFFCRSITSLFYLFRGKKRNPLRKMRTDYATYDLDQLLLGTIFFTILLFLWLTVATYYALFSLIRLFNVSLIATLQTALAFINHLPLFALMLRVKDPARLPGGVAFRVQKGKEEEDYIPTTDLEMINVPLSLSDIFRGQERHVQNLTRLPGLALQILIGKRI